MKNEQKCSMRLYRIAGGFAIGALLTWPVVFLLQGNLLKKTFAELIEQGRDLPQVFKELFDLLNDTHTSLAYDMPHMPALAILLPFLLVFAICCLKVRDRKRGKRLCCLIAGAGLECYAMTAFLSNVLMAAFLYYREWSAGVSHKVILKILFTAFGSGVAELAMISLFAISLLITGYTYSNRPFAVASGAICFYRLLEDSLWLFTGVFDGTLASVPKTQIAHGAVFLLAMSLTFGCAVLVAMSSVKEEPEEGQEVRQCG